MCAGPPATLDCKKRSNSKLAESRRRVDGFPGTAFVNWANLCSMACSSMHSRAVSLSFEPYVLGAEHHWQKGNASSFSPWHFEHRTLPRVSDTRISVLGEVLVTGIPVPETRRDSTAPRVGRMERISRSRFRRACRLWCGVCVGGAGGGILVRSCRAGFRYCVLIGRCDRSRCAPCVLVRWRLVVMRVLAVCAYVRSFISACVLVRWRLVVMRVLAALCVCAFVYQCMGGVV